MSYGVYIARSTTSIPRPPGLSKRHFPIVTDAKRKTKRETERRNTIDQKQPRVSLLMH